MPEGGDLFLEITVNHLGEADIKSHAIRPGRYARIAITDTGVGMDEASRQKVFDPFFTTKEKGRGTGLGLASAYGIIKNHGGFISVYSEVGHGSTFNIHLPLSPKEARRQTPAQERMLKGSETILLVDDEDLVLDVGQAMLSKLGYRVITAKGGKQAIATFKSRSAEIDLVILDLIMPDMDGGTTFDRIHELQPEMPVILSSGYAINGQATDILRRGCNGFIQKPFGISALSQKLREILDGNQ
jgi:CheY-like chemotaxis protein